MPYNPIPSSKTAILRALFAFALSTALFGLGSADQVAATSSSSLSPQIIITTTPLRPVATPHSGHTGQAGHTINRVISQKCQATQSKAKKTGHLTVKVVCNIKEAAPSAKKH